jgi:hypothetical protein
MAATEATDHSLLSSYREMLLEHLFAGEVMRRVWLSGIKAAGDTEAAGG